MHPALFFIGPEKTGTTSIWSALSKAGVPLPKNLKETFYFDRHYDADIRTFFRLHSHVEGSPIADVSPSYFYGDQVPERIHDMFPQARIVITLREPVARTISMYRHLLRNGWIQAMPVETALREAPQLLPGSRYREHCRRWFRVFGPQNILVLRQRVNGEFSDEIFPALAEFSQIDRLIEARMPLKRLNTSSSARFAGVAAAVNKLNYFLKKHNAEFLVRASKRLGLGLVLYSRDPNRLAPVSEQDRRLLSEILADEVAFFVSLPHEINTGEEVLKRLEDAVAGCRV